ncbi:MAG: acetolactate decarboxylase [Candidatus Marinamargulisbacteria bacterium]|jgi:acetolactate decarboxylase
MKTMVFFLLAMCLFSSGCQDKSRQTLWQIAPVHNLIQGDYSGKMNYKAVKKMGDFGIGTFQDIDGELVILDGHFFQIKSNGHVSEVSDQQTTPYASLHFFNADKEVKLRSQETFDVLQASLAQWVLPDGLVYGIKIRAQCRSIRLRSPRRQQKPYPALSKVLQTQSIFEPQNVSGTLVGYYSPSFLGRIIVPGFHFHFISDDGTIGGHVLDLNLEYGTVFFDTLDTVSLKLFQLPEDNKANHAQESNAQAIFNGR